MKVNNEVVQMGKCCRFRKGSLTSALPTERLLLRVDFKQHGQKL